MARLFSRNASLWILCICIMCTSMYVNAAALRLQRITAHVYAIVGPFGNRSPQNLGNNATFGFVVTHTGVVLFDSGGSYQGAAAIHRIIRQVTDKPVKIVVNTGGQDHRWFGNGYFKAHGAHIIASAAAVADQQARLQDEMYMMGNLIGSKALKDTDAVYADETFSGKKDFSLGGTRFELLQVGPAHTPGDIIAYLPQEQIVFSGDVVFVGRMLGVQPQSNSRHWIHAFETMAALSPKVIVPGHGPATDLAHARKDTYDYLVFLRDRVAKFMKAGGDISQVGTLDQSRFSYLQDYNQIKGRNAQQVYQAMEWE